jgi:hypothetical protein
MASSTAAAAGLGFGMTENFLYFTSVGATADVGAWVRHGRRPHASTARSCTVPRRPSSAPRSASRRSAAGIAKLFVVPLRLRDRDDDPPALWNGFITADAAAQNGIFTLTTSSRSRSSSFPSSSCIQVCLWDRAAHDHA